MEDAALTEPYRISTDACWIPATSVKLDPVPSFEDRADELRGIEGGVPQIIDAYNPTGTLATRAYVNQLTWLLHAAGMEGAFTAGDGVITDPDSDPIPAGASRWVFTKRGGVTAKSLQIEPCYVSDGLFLKGQGFGVSEITWDTGGPLDATLMGLVVGKQVDPDLTPAYDAETILPIRRGNLSLTWLTGGASIDEGFSISLANPLNQMHSAELTTPSFFPDKLEHANEKVRLTGTVPKHAVDPEDWDKFMDASTFVAKAKWASTSHIGATAYPYSMWIEMPKCQYVGGEGPSELTNARRHAASYNWYAAWDTAAGYDFRITLVNSVTAIETYA